MLERAAERPPDDWPDSGLLLAYHELGDVESASALAGRIDSLPGGSAILVRALTLFGTVPFDLADTPNFARRLEVAGIDISEFGVPAEARQE